MPAEKALHKGTVRITVPVSVAYNLEKFQKSLATIAERLGCLACFSGADCTFQLERDFLLDDRLGLAAAVGRRGAVTDAGPSVTARITTGVSNNLKLLQRTVATIAGKVGCPQCTSGWDIIFQQELKRVNPVRLKINAEGGIG